ncbi:hypothetical protein [Streptomyces sp. KL2]|uniref:hypothetical protein n=1 Tax=Streptomyces sp. KL2 TaxID=3050126 RepID=UPI00397C8E81
MDVNHLERVDGGSLAVGRGADRTPVRVRVRVRRESRAAARERTRRGEDTARTPGLC